jgi:hypothetical protein
MKVSMLKCNTCRRSGRGLLYNTISTRSLKGWGNLSSCWDFSPGRPQHKAGSRPIYRDVGISTATCFSSFASSSASLWEPQISHRASPSQRRLTNVLYSNKRYLQWESYRTRKTLNGENAGLCSNKQHLQLPLRFTMMKQFFLNRCSDSLLSALK